MRVSILLVGIVTLAACGNSVPLDADSSVPPPSATDYVVIDPPTTTVPVTEPPLPTDATGQVVTTTTLPTEYEVRANDSVFRIADRFGLTPEELAELNGWSDGISHTILPGDVIRIAPETTAPPSSGAVPVSGSVPGECPTTYTIQRGDTTRIGVAERFGITFEEMDAANENTPGYEAFVVGTPITIPCPS